MNQWNANSKRRLIEIIYNLRQKEFIFFAKQYVGQNESEEIVSEAFLSLLEHLDDVDGEDEIMCFLYKEIRKLCFIYLQEPEFLGIIGGLIQGDENWEENIKIAEYVTQVMLDLLDVNKAEREKELEKAIELLPPQQKRVFKLYRLGLTTREIADLLGLSDQTVRNHKKLAIDFLKGYFGKRPLD